MCGGSPSTPPPPPRLPEAAVAPNAGINKARAGNKKGRLSTVLTGARGLTDQATGAPKTLLGG